MSFYNQNLYFRIKNIFPAREEEVPDPAAPAEGEYAEYTEEQQYAVSQSFPISQKTHFTHFKWHFERD